VRYVIPYPHSNTRHLVTNVRLRPVEAGELPVCASFTVWRFQIACRLLGDGARVRLAGLTGADVEMALDQLGAPAGQVTGFAGDLALPRSAHQLLAHALGRGAETDEVAAAVAFLAREDSRFITGQILSVNGGSSMS